MSADRMTELLSWAILAAALALGAVIIYSGNAVEQGWLQRQVIQAVPK